jgi:hypothetical protein
MGHRRFLPQGHIWRKKKKVLFDGTEDHRITPNELSGDQLLQKLMDVPPVEFEKDKTTRKRKRSELELNWTKKSIFFLVALLVNIEIKTQLRCHAH